MTQKIVVQLGKRSYPIFITRDRFRSLGPALRERGLGGELFVVALPDARKRYGKFLRKSVNKSGIKIYFTKAKFPKGIALEKAKSQKYVDLLLRELVQRSKGGKQIVMASFSGGVLGDLTGYVASIFKRGIPYIHIPTTLLSQVDSSIGGKVGIDRPEGKNLVGSIYQPRLVYADLSVFETLDALGMESVKDGMGEVVKYAMIADPRLFSYLEKNHNRLISKKPDLKSLEYIVATCAKIKADVVSRDERDTKGIRVALNFGHTIGHAIEQAKGYHGIRHGHAISVGMLCAARIAVLKSFFTGKDFERLESLLGTFKLPCKMKGISLKKLLQAESHDKKFIHGKNRYVLPVRIGKVVVREGIPHRVIRKVISERLS